MFLFCLVLAMFCARLFICALWSPAGKGLTSWLSFVVSSVSLSLSHGILGQVWYLIVSIPDLCNLITFIILYIFNNFEIKKKKNYSLKLLPLKRQGLVEINKQHRSKEMRQTHDTMYCLCVYTGR